MLVDEQGRPIDENGNLIDENGNTIEGGKGPEETGGGTGGKAGKTFTQEEVNRLLKAEKESSKKSLLKELGVEEVKTAKEGLEKYKEILDKDKSETEKANELAAQAAKDKAEAVARAAEAEAKVELLVAGCKAEFLEDVIILALRRVSDDKDLATVVKEMKEETKYSTFFGGDDSGSGDRGTGGGSGYRKPGGDDKKGSFGAKLAESSANSVGKNPYFNN